MHLKRYWSEPISHTIISSYREYIVKHKVGESPSNRLIHLGISIVKPWRQTINLQLPPALRHHPRFLSTITCIHCTLPYFQCSPWLCCAFNEFHSPVAVTMWPFNICSLPMQRNHNKNRSYSRLFLRSFFSQPPSSIIAIDSIYSCHTVREEETDNYQSVWRRCEPRRCMMPQIGRTQICLYTKMVLPSPWNDETMKRWNLCLFIEERTRKMDSPYAERTS